MAFKTFAPGVLTSSDVNTFLMRQAVIVCTSSTRPASPNEGMTIFETDTDFTLQYTGTAWVRIANIGAWTSWTPVYSGTGWTFTTVTSFSSYIRFGRLVVCNLRSTFTTVTQGAGRLEVTLPFTAAADSTENAPWGLARFNDVSAGAPFSGFIAAENADTTKATFFVGGAAATYVTVNGVTGTVPFTWANTDTVAATFTYLAAS
jgi:hypothetical protein